MVDKRGEVDCVAEIKKHIFVYIYHTQIYVTLFLRILIGYWKF